MDFQKIIDCSLAETNNEFGDNPRFQFKGPSTEKECIAPHIMLRFYSERLLENYHAELQKVLQKQGIRI